jgi:DNA-binding NarL/FixJ family response regulator
VQLVLCDDHRLFAEPFATALVLRGHQVVVTTTPAQAIQAVDECEPDVCLIDLRFPDGNSLDAIAELRTGHPDCPVVVLSASADLHDQSAVAAAGAAAFLRKDQSVSAIFEALDRIVSGRPVAVPPLPRASVPSEQYSRVHGLVAQLTTRERQVLRHLVEAEETIVIANLLGVAPSTARTYLQNVLFKLGVHTRLQAVALVVTAGLDGEL